MLRLLSISLLALILTGCASSAKVENMLVNAPQVQTYDAALRDNMKITSVNGGGKTNPLWTSQIEGADFRSALEQSLSKAGLLGQSDKANYVLRANLVSLDQPLFGLNFTVTSMVEYNLVDNATGRVIWTDKVEAPFTAGVSDSFFGVKRLRLANEGSARENINELLKRLAGLKLGAGQVSLSQ